MSLSLAQRIDQISKNLDLMRTVTLKIYYQNDATDAMRAEGHTFSKVISPNFVVMPPVIDVLDESKMDGLRQLWLEKVRSVDEGPSLPLFQKDETVDDRFYRLLGEMDAASPDGITEIFVRGAKYPVPPEYAVRLPLPPSNMRHEILEQLVPFKETRAMLMRLEGTLDLPMRALVIGHTRTHALDGMKQLMN